MIQRSSSSISELGNLPCNSSKWHVLLATWLGEMFDGMDASIMILVLYPALSQLCGTTSHSIVGEKGSIIVAALMIGWAFGGTIFGALADRIGRAKTLIYTILLYAICTGLCALAHSWQELAFYRFLVGLGIGGEISLGGVMIAESWRGHARLNATGFMCSSFSCGYLLAAILNYFIGGFGWRWLFAVGIVPALLTAYIRTKIQEPVQFELLRQYKLKLRAKPKGELTQSEAELLKFTFLQIFNAHNIRNAVLLVALASSAIVGYWAVLSWIPPWINQLVGTAAVHERSVAAIWMNISGIIGAILAGSFVRWLGRRISFLVMFTGALLSCLGTFLTVKTLGVPLLIGVFLINFFSGAVFSLLFIYIPELFETKIRATAFGFCMQCGRLVAATAALISGHLIAMFGGLYAPAACCIALFYLVGIIASLFIKNPRSDILRDLEGHAQQVVGSRT